MRILSVNKFYYLKGGCEAYLFSLNRLLEEKGMEVVPFSMKHQANVYTPFESYFIENVDYWKAGFFKKIKYSAKIIYSLEADRKIGRIARDAKPDLAHVHNYYHQLSPSVLRSLKKHGIPIVQTVHDLKPLCPNYKMLSGGKVCERCRKFRYYNCLVERCVKGSLPASLTCTLESYFNRLIGSYDCIDIYITPSLFFRNKFLEYGYPAKKVKYVPNFVDTRFYKPCYEAGNYLVYFGRLSEDKGVLTLTRAMKSVRDISLYIVGEGPLKEKIYRCMNENDIRNVCLTGFKTGRELEELVRGSRFTVLPSELYENCPISVLESMAWGKPVIGSDIGGIRELVRHGATGLLFEPGNPEQLAERINYLCNKPSEAKRMGMEARKRVEAEFDSEKHFESIFGIYNSLVSSYGRQV